jgi:glycosyltransferase involved in cell wall biosynthesis
MKIAYDSQIFTNQIVGGVSRYYWELSKNIFLLGENVSIFAGLFQNEYLNNENGVNLIGKKISYPKYSIRFFQTLNTIVSHNQIKNWKPDIIHCTYYSQNLYLPKHRPQIVTVYDMIHELFKDEFRNRHLITKQKKAAVNRADHIICISHSTKSDLINLFGIDKSKISVVHLGVELKDFNYNKEIKNSYLRPFILYVGQRSGYKNFNKFIEAFSKSKFITKEFDIVAFGGGPFDKSELSYFKKINLDKKISQVQGDENKLKEYYASASAFVYPSVYEGFGLPPLEAMASGCPVISSNSSSMPEVIRSAGEYFDPNCLDSMIYAMESVLMSNTKPQELISKGYDNLANFTWQKCANETLAVYKKFNL